MVDAYDVISELFDAPEYYLKMMGAAYMEEFDVKPEDLVLVTIQGPDGRTTYHWTTWEDGEDEPNEAFLEQGAGRQRGRNRSRSWASVGADWCRGFARGLRKLEWKLEARFHLWNRSVTVGSPNERRTRPTGTT